MSLTSHPAYPTTAQIRQEDRIDAIAASHEEAARETARILETAGREIEALDLRIGIAGYDRQDILDTVADMARAARRPRNPEDLELLARDLLENEEDV